MVRPVALIILAFPLLTRLAASQVSLLAQLDEEVVALTAATRKCVVQVTVQPSAERLREKREAEQGFGGVTLSGLVVSADGLVATVGEPLRSGDRYMVELASGGQLRAALVKIDDDSGLGFLRIQATGLTAAVPFTGEIAPGALLLAVGHGKPQSATPSIGFLIGGGREAAISKTVHKDLLEASAGASSDDRGGVLVRPNGQVVALILGSPEQVMGFGEIPLSQVCFGIPIARVLSVRDKLLAALHDESGRQDRRGWLGIRAQDLASALREKWPLAADGGVLIQLVTEDSPAHKAGLKANDIILAWEGERVSDSLDLLNRVESSTAGTQVKLDVLRDGQRMTVVLTLGEW